MQSPTQKLIVKETVYWQSRGSAPQSSTSSFSRSGPSEEVPYLQPRVKVGADWQPVNVGWVTRVGLLKLENLPEVRNTIPSKEEVKVAKSRVLEVGVVGEEGDVFPFHHVPVGESARICPPHGDSGGLRVRCLQGETRVDVTAFPAGGD